MKNVRMIMLVLAAILFLSAPWASATITIISESYSVSGGDYEGYLTPYNLSGNTPVYGSSEVWAPIDVSYPEYGFGVISAHSGASANFVFADGQGTYSAPTYANATTTSVFSSTEENLQINYFGGVWGSSEPGTGTWLLFGLTGPGISDGYSISPSGEFDITQNYIIEPLGIYELTLCAWADTGPNTALAHVTATVIPEPATLLLLSLGAVMLRRKRS